MQALSTVILEPPKIESVTVSIVFLSICQELMGQDVMIFIFLNVDSEASFFILLFHFHQEIL